MLVVCLNEFASGAVLTEICRLNARRTQTFVEVAELKSNTWSGMTRRIIAWLGAVTLMRMTILCTMGSYTFRVSDPVNIEIA